jgi:hypothetical protein
MQASRIDPGRWQGLVVLTGAAASCLGLGLLTSQAPIVGVAVALGALGLSLGLFFPRVPPRSFALLLGIGLVGYAFMGRPFAHLGRAPVFIGELVLAAGLLFAVLDSRRFAAFRSPVAWIIVAYLALGAVRTAPYFGTYGMMAVRDGVLWIYAVFALLVAGVVLRLDLVRELPERYGRLVPYFLVWVPIGFLGFKAAGVELPPLPGSEIPLSSLKGGDLGVHLGGAAAFLILGLHRSGAGRAASRLERGEWVWWSVWVVAFISVGSLNRGGMLSAALAGAVALLFAGTAAMRRMIVLGGAVGLIVITSLSLDLKYDAGHREISARQIVDNVTSIVDDEPKSGLSGTREWRLQWWTDVVNYTVYGDYFWTGKGFGVNLADDDGYQIKKESAVRSPHNGHVSILARMGVPGFVLWTLLQLVFASGLVVAFFRARQRGQSWWAQLNIWILAYWTAFMVNTSFDVFIEGPQGGIWFWSLIGFGIAAMLTQQANSTHASAPYRGPAWRSAPVGVSTRIFNERQ